MYAAVIIFESIEFIYFSLSDDTDGSTASSSPVTENVKKNNYHMVDRYSSDFFHEGRVIFPEGEAWGEYEEPEYNNNP